MKFKSSILFLLILSLFYINTVNAQGYKIKTIVIDAGHGGVKPGASGKYSLEKTVALKVALKLGKMLEEEILTSRRDPAIPGCIRINVGNREENEKLINLLKRI